MATIDYIIGQSGTLGIVVNQYDGTPMPLDDLGLRLTIYVPGEDIEIDGQATSGEVDLGDGPIMHPSIAKFNIRPAVMPGRANLYPATLEVNSGSGWHVVARHYINVRRYE